MEIPLYITIPQRMINDLQLFIEYSTNLDREVGGFLIQALHGEVGIVGTQFGEDDEIDLKPNEVLYEGEKYLGTYHAHPITKWFSIGDLISYLDDEYEKVMVNTGEDGSVNIAIKTDKTPLGDFTEELEEFEQEDMKDLANVFSFLWYRGMNGEPLQLQNDDIEEFTVVNETWDITELLSALGIEGTEDIPEEYSTKK